MIGDSKLRLIAAAGALATLLLACTQPADEANATRPAAPASGGMAPAESAGPAIDADLVSAVTTGQRDGAGMSLKFKLASRPAVGTALAVDLWLLPDDEREVSELRLSLRADPGLRLESERSLQLTVPLRGEAATLQVQVTPEAAGVHNLAATVLMDSDVGPTTRTYYIPIIAQ